VYTVAVYLIVL